MTHRALSASSCHLALPQNTDSAHGCSVALEHCARFRCNAWQRLEAADSDESSGHTANMLLPSKAHGCACSSIP